ncbi:MAG: NUDIX domain-containing protein [Bacteroidota bacterium]
MKKVHSMMKQERLLKARGVLRHGDSILLCYNKAQQFYFLPGGSLEAHESLPQCLARELLEECQLRVAVGNFLGCLECHWQTNQVQYQELDFIFQLHATKDSIPTAVHSLEDHISFSFLKEADIKADKYRLLPTSCVQFLDASIPPHYLFEKQ